MFSKTGPITILLLVATVTLASVPNLEHVKDRRLTVTSSGNRATSFSFNLSELQRDSVLIENTPFEAFSIPGEGFTYERDKPILPAVSRFVIVPPQAGLELVIRADEPHRIRASNPPLLCADEQLNDANPDDKPDGDLYPSVIAEMSKPIVLRGVRLVSVTTYPVQFDYKTGEYLKRDHIEAEIRYTDDPPVNPVNIPIRRSRSREFLKFIDALAINGEAAGRDDPDNDQEPEYVGHYLIVAHENCVEFISEFIEWRRKSGWKVEIVSVPSNITHNPTLIKELIQDCYDEYLEEGLDPFDNILLVGDRSTYHYAEREPQWILHAEEGATIFDYPSHADYLYGCLEGDDDFPDVAISRWCAGDEETLGLFVGRTLSYEARPYMEETDWFTKGAVFSNHWGNGPDIGTWHIRFIQTLDGVSRFSSIWDSTTSGFMKTTTGRDVLITSSVNSNVICIMKVLICCLEEPETTIGGETIRVSKITLYSQFVC